MDINELITIVKNKLLNQINIESINIEDKSFLHKNHKGNQEGKYHLKLIIVSQELKKMNKIESNKKIYKRLDHLLGKNFAILSKTPYEISDENQDYLNFLGCSSLILEEEYLEDNPWLESFMKQEKIYLVRPDRYIFGSTDSSISLDQLIDDLKNRIGI